MVLPFLLEISLRFVVVSGNDTAASTHVSKHLEEEAKRDMHKVENCPECCRPACEPIRRLANEDDSYQQHL